VLDDGVADRDAIGAMPSAATRDTQPPGDIGTALWVTVAVVIVSAGVSIALSLAFPQFRYTSIYGLTVAAIVGGFVFRDVRSIDRPEITGSPSMWWAGTTLFLIVALPLYLYRRPQYLWRARHETPWTREQLYDPTNPFVDEPQRQSSSGPLG
jgi:hypothetical protein